MSPRSKEPKIVAELGRPETPEETAARKAENSRLYRARKTINNLILSLLVTVGFVAVIYFMVPRAETAPNWAVDYQELSLQAEQSLSEELIVPELPETWKANDATLRQSSVDDVSSWYIGFITPSDEFIGYEQAFNANPTWISHLFKDFPPTGSVSIDGQNWVEYDNRSMEDAGNAAYGLSTTSGNRTIVIYGTASDEEFRSLASAISAQMQGRAL